MLRFLNAFSTSFFWYFAIKKNSSSPINWATARVNSLQAASLNISFSPHNGAVKEESLSSFYNSGN